MSEITTLTNNNQNGLKVDIIKAKAANDNVHAEKKATKPKKRDKSDLGDNFVPPDGGWGWAVAIASGLGTLVTFAMLQQYGIIFRERLTNLGINSSQMTTIVNTQTAVSSCTGLVNGPVFRRFSYRQVAYFGAFAIFIGLLCTAFADSFILYMITIAFMYGIGRGFFVSASSLALNTFFRVKRRTATGYQWTMAGVGPMFLPYLSTYLLKTYGVQGTVLIFAAISLNTVACAMIFQPVKWHVKKPKDENKSLKNEVIDVDDKEANEAENEHRTALHTTDPETPMMPRANDGWYGSKLSLNSARHYRRSSSVVSIKFRPRNKTLELKEAEGDGELTYNKTLLNNNNDRYKSEQSLAKNKEEHEEHLEEMEKLPWYKKVAIFFDLDLLKDKTYLNLAIGLTIINFTEVNFAVLTPFILNDFGFDYRQIAIAMSVLATLDLIVRFIIPFATAKIKLDNKTFYLIGVAGTSLGRIIVAHSRDFNVTLGAFAWIGMNKAFRIIFTQLIIPGYVPLKRLPAAAGLQLLISGLFTLACGPIVGLIRDATDYTVTIHFLNGLCYIAAALWILEDICKLGKKKTAQEEEST